MLFLLAACSSGGKTVEYETKYSKFKISYNTPEGYKIYFPETDLTIDELYQRDKDNSAGKGERAAKLEAAKDDGEIVLYMDFRNKLIYNARYERAKARAELTLSGESNGTETKILDEYEKDKNKYMIYSETIPTKPVKYVCLIDITGSEKQGVECYSLTSEEELRKMLDVIKFTPVKDFDVEMKDELGMYQ